MGTIAALLSVLAPAALQLFQGWTQSNPGASDDEAKAELQRLVSSDEDASQAYLDLKAEIAAAKAKAAGGV